MICCKNGDDHQKVWSQEMLMSKPPQKKWICSECGEMGSERVGHFDEPKISYREIYEKFYGSHRRNDG